MGIKNNIEKFRSALQPYGAKLIAVSKTHSAEKIREAYEADQRIFGENKVQELVEKHPLLPEDVEWHLIGHLQRNKVKQVAPFVSLIHSVDSLKLLEEINKQGQRHNLVIHCLLQVYIAREETKFGLDVQELHQLLQSSEINTFSAIAIDGLMGIASMTDDQLQIRNEFRLLRQVFDDIKKLPLPAHIQMKELSMGMSSDYQLALDEGSTLVRIGTAIFGDRNYTTS
jgi:pyridoxal phosphate enzyme (YggS family)